MNGASLSTTVILCSLVAVTWAQTSSSSSSSSSSGTTSVNNDTRDKVKVLNLFYGLITPNGSSTSSTSPPRTDVSSNLQQAMKLGRNQAYSSFVPYHQRLTGYLMQELLGKKNFSDFYTTAQFCHDNINQDMFIFALSEAILTRNDTRDLPLPSLLTITPYKFLSEDVLNAVRRQSGQTVQKRSATQCPVELPFQHSDTDPVIERRLDYFREDIALNLNHWFWHLLYPFSGPRSIVQKDRRGEIFYYFHQQIVARYNLERNSNDLGLVVPITSLYEPLREGYDPGLTNEVTGRPWEARADNSFLRDVNRTQDQLQTSLRQMDQWYDTIMAAIYRGSVVNGQGQTLPLDINLLGDMVEASNISINLALYGDWHNSGHVTIGFVHDPDGRRGEGFGVMADSATAMRDIAFYRWHKATDIIFQEHKRRIARYTVQQLSFPGVYVAGLDVFTPGFTQNVMSTFWQRSQIDLSSGVDFNTTGPAAVCITHLQHAVFTYRIRITNEGPARSGMVRIFLGPRYDAFGSNFEELRLLFIEMDKFPVSLRTGTNEIWRMSNQSSVAIPFERTFRRIRNNLTGDALAEFNYCGCGWPQHLLIPKGWPQGMPMYLYVMVSDFDQDKVEQPNLGGCGDAASYCGLRNQLYPDRRSMGYPFDRSARSGVSTLLQFLTANMGVQTVYIRFKDVVVQGPTL